MKAKFMLLCKEVIIDGVNGGVSTVSIIDGVQALGFPSRIPPTKLLILVKKEKNESDKSKCTVLMKLYGETFAHDFEADFDGNLTNRIIVNVPDIELKGPGEVVFTLREGNKKIASYDIQVQMMTPGLTELPPEL